MIKFSKKKPWNSIPKKRHFVSTPHFGGTPPFLGGIFCFWGQKPPFLGFGTHFWGPDPTFWGITPTFRVRGLKVVQNFKKCNRRPNFFVQWLIFLCATLKIWVKHHFFCSKNEFFHSTTHFFVCNTKNLSRTSFFFDRKQIFSSDDSFFCV